MMLAMPKFMEHKEAYYFDPREMRMKLTDKVTQEDVDSYLEYFTLTCPQNYENLAKQTAKDIEEYRANKHRYTFEYDIGSYTLTAIDGEPVKILNEFDM